MPIIIVPSPKHPVCDFCLSPDVAWAYPCPPFEIPALDWGSLDDYWAACLACAALIEQGELAPLVQHSLDVTYRQAPGQEVRTSVTAIQGAFLSKRSGPRIPATEWAPGYRP